MIASRRAAASPTRATCLSSSAALSPTFAPAATAPSLEGAGAGTGGDDAGVCAGSGASLRALRTLSSDVEGEGAGAARGCWPWTGAGSSSEARKTTVPAASHRSRRANFIASTLFLSRGSYSWDSLPRTVDELAGCTVAKEREREREDERALEGLSAFERFFFVEGAKCCLNEMKSFAYIFKDEPHLPSIQPSLGSLSQARASTPRSTPLPLLFLVRAFPPFTETVAIYN